MADPKHKALCVPTTFSRLQLVDNAAPLRMQCVGGGMGVSEE